MDVVLAAADSVCLDAAWQHIQPAWNRDHVVRQAVSLYVITMVGVLLLYFGVAGLSYAFLFDKRMEKHPRFLKQQKRKEVMMSLKGFPWLDIMTLPWFLGEVRGYSQVYDGIENSPLGHGFKRGVVYAAFSSLLFLGFTDFMIYWVHRILHWPSVYKHLHKPHHKWVIPTPFASHAFHPIDGYLQSLPYHMFIYLVPIHKFTFLGLFVFVNLWSIMIHDSDMIVGHPLENIINGPAHHTLHHMYFVYNYGQYFTWCDKTGGSYRHPEAKDDPLLTVLSMEEAKKKLAEEKKLLEKGEEIRVELKRNDSAFSSTTETRSDEEDSGFEATSGSGTSEGGEESEDENGKELAAQKRRQQASLRKRK